MIRIIVPDAYHNGMDNLMRTRVALHYFPERNLYPSMVLGWAHNVVREADAGVEYDVVTCDYTIIKSTELSGGDCEYWVWDGECWAYSPT